MRVPYFESFKYSALGKAMSLFVINVHLTSAYILIIILWSFWHLKDRRK